MHIVAVGAHPDDIELSMAGLLIQAARSGHRVTWIVATDGAAGGGKRDPELAKRRQTEAAAGAACGGATLISLGFPDGQLAWQTDVRPILGSQLVTLGPDLVVTHALNDYHPDHRAVARLVDETAPLGVAVMRADTMLGLHFVPELLLDISEVFDAKLAALGEHKSQATLGMEEGLRVWNRFRGLQSGARRFGYAEAYGFEKRLGLDWQPLLDRLGSSYLLL